MDAASGMRRRMPLDHDTGAHAGRFHKLAWIGAGVALLLAWASRSAQVER